MGINYSFTGLYLSLCPDYVTHFLEINLRGSEKSKSIQKVFLCVYVCAFYLFIYFFLIQTTKNGSQIIRNMKKI